MLEINCGVSTRMAFTSPRVRGEVGILARSAMMPGEGASHFDKSPSSRPSPRKNGEKERAGRVATLPLNDE